MKNNFEKKNPEFNFDNFFTNTYVSWKACETPDRPEDFISSGGSKYWNMGDHVIRQSDHWGFVQGCTWVLPGNKKEELVSAKADFADFIPKEEMEKLFEEAEASKYELGEVFSGKILFPMKGVIEQTSFKVVSTKAGKKMWENVANSNHKVEKILVQKEQ